MAATLRASAVTNITASGLSHVLNLPTGIKVDQLLRIVLVVTQTNTGVTIPGWTEYKNESYGAGTLRAFWRKADLSEGATVTATASQSSRVQARATRWSDWHGTSAPEAVTGDSFGSSVDPAALAPSWGSAASRWVVDIMSVKPLSAYGANVGDDHASDYLNNHTSTTASHTATATTFDPDAFTLSGSGYWVYAHSAIRPGTAGPDTLPLALDQDPAPLVLSGGEQSVGFGQPLAIYQHPATLIISGGEQSIGNVIERYILLAGPNGEETPDRLDDDISGMTYPIVGLRQGDKPYATDHDVHDHTGVPGVGGGGGGLFIDLAVSGAYEIDAANGTTQDLTLVGDATFTIVGATVGDATDLRLLLWQDGTGGREVTWPVEVSWVGGVEPTLQTDPAALDVIGLLSDDDGASWLGFHSGSPAFAVPAIVLGTAAVEGAAQSVIRSDATIAAFDAVAPSTLDYSDGASTGVVAFAARRDHHHGMPASAAAAAEHHILLANGHATPFTFNDMLQMDDGSDFMWSDV